MQTSRRVVSRRLSDQVEQHLLSMIQSGEYGPGDRFPSERELMEMFEVGRSSVREALFALQRKGFVRINRGDRPKVIEPEPARLAAEFSDVVRIVLSRPDGILHFNQARCFFEAGVARFAAGTATADQIDRLELALERNRAAIGDFDRFRTTDIAFHREIAAISDNPIVLSVHDALVEWVMSKRVLRGDVEANNRASFAGHEAVVAAIRTGDGERAYAEMTTHIARARHEYELTA